MMDWQRQERIKIFLSGDGVKIWGDIYGEVDSDDLAALLLRFEHFLLHCEAERQKR